MITDGRILIENAVNDLNTLNILKHDIHIPDLYTATGTRIDEIINYFLDNVESTPENKEYLLTKNIISAYNIIVDKAVSFDIQEIPSFDIDKVEYKRTKFYD